MTSVSLTGSDSIFLSLDPNSSKDDEATETCMVDDDASIIIDEDDEDYEYLQNTYFRAGHDGCDEYTNLTTFHGMIRVFNSRNCPSLIFWCLVVTTCLVFYMMVCGTMLKSYSTQPSFLRTHETATSELLKDVILCSEHFNQTFDCNDISIDTESFCQKVAANDNCILLIFARKVKLKIMNQKSNLYMKIGSEEDIVHLTTSKTVHHRLRLKLTQITRLNLRRAKCYEKWKHVEWLTNQYRPNGTYSMKQCEAVRMDMLSSYENYQKYFPCLPSCFERRYNIKYSRTSHTSSFTTITIIVNELVTEIQETRKTTLTDVLCFLGGASSLFMGCSCVTLMEMFIFLFKLVSNSVWSKDPPELEEEFIEDKFEFEYSDHKNKRRYAIFDKETMEKYYFSSSSMDQKSINLDKRYSIFSKSGMKKAPKLNSLRDNRNFSHVDIYDTGVVSQSTKDDSTYRPDEYSVDLQDETLDTFEPLPLPSPEIRSTRPPLRRGSTTTSHTSHNSQGSSSTNRTHLTIHPVRQYRRIFSRNMPMNDF